MGLFASFCPLTKLSRQWLQNECKQGKILGSLKTVLHTAQVSCFLTLSIMDLFSSSAIFAPVVSVNSVVLVVRGDEAIQLRSRTLDSMTIAAQSMSSLKRQSAQFLKYRSFKRELRPFF